MPTTHDNVRDASWFPHRDIGTQTDLQMFPPEKPEVAMAQRRKSSARKATARKRTTKKTTAARRKAGTRKTGTRKTSSRRWSQRVTQRSDALDLDRGVFKQTSAKKIAVSLKRSAERSSRRKAGAYRSALSMLTFYINRAGKTLPQAQRARLERAKAELKRQFGRE
ncbi:hypothetical protein ACVJGD_006410 [Bradyrhizobium sp. USDA 10063]